jgi:hypothetical protein
VVAAYALPAALTWMLLGLGVAAVAQSQAAASRAVLGGAALVAALAYSGYYGVSEAVGRPGVRPPGRSWQVPQTMVIGASPRRRLVVWGAVLGPGFLTRNPYAGFGLLPLALIAAGSAGLPAALIVGAAIGIAHGTARALALMRDVRDMPLHGPVDDHMELLLKTVRWRTVDGYLLLAVAGTAVATLAYQFS